MDYFNILKYYFKDIKIKVSDNKENIIIQDAHYIITKYNIKNINEPPYKKLRLN
jgi:hypothetical protein